MSIRTIEKRKTESIFMIFPIMDDDGEATIIPATMSGSYKVVDSTGAEIDAAALVKTGDNKAFELKITQTEVATWDVGTYNMTVLVIEVTEDYGDIIADIQIELAEAP